MRRAVGLDINGWRDFGCRDWEAEEPDEIAERLVVLDGGIRSVTVEHDDILVGGPQAILSPVGRGLGWSTIGDPSKRRSLAQHWSALLAGTPGRFFERDVRAAAGALSLLADQRVICMPDHIRMGEVQQNGLLAALAGPREPRSVLLWRSVAVVLGLLDGGGLPEAVDGMRIACLIHGADGVERQVLVLRKLIDHPDQLAPERAGPGDVCCSALGIVTLMEYADAAVATANPVLGSTKTDSPGMAAELLFREAPQGDEIVRRINSNWLRLIMPVDFAIPGLAEALEDVNVEADCVVVLSPLAARHRKLLAKGAARNRSGRAVIVADPDMAARGALFAARRIERGIPHYLDRLEQVSLIVMRGDEPAFDDLIPADAMVPGNREYVSRPITSMIWTPGMKKVQFYIRKGPREIRHWVTDEQVAPEREERLEIQLRQMPAQGWAKLSVTSPDWEALRRAPINLDWGALPIDPRTEGDILASLERPRPIIPQRVRYAPHLAPWDGSARNPGVRAVLKSFNAGSPSSLKALADAVSASLRVEVATSGERRFETVYPVGTDGELPDTLDEAVRRQFDGVINRVTDSLLQTIRKRSPLLDNNNALRCLSWIFARCPMEVQREMAAALDAIRSNRDHPLLAPRQSARVVIHGLGRVVTDSELLRSLIPKLYADIVRPNFLAALSSLLSRPEATPTVLTDADVETISERTILVFRELRSESKFGPNLKYALMVVAGLLRVRERDPWALVSGRSRLAQLLVEELSSILAQIRSMPQPIRNQVQKLHIIMQLIPLLSGEGGRLDILTMMDDMSDE